MMERPCADFEEKHEPVSDIDIAVVDSLKVLDPKRPIREADMAADIDLFRCVPQLDSCTAANSAFIRLPRRQLLANFAVLSARASWLS